MDQPDLRTLSPGILQEPIADGDQVIIWLPETGSGQSGYWERIATVPRVKTEHDTTLSYLQATSIRARTLHPWAKLWRGIRPGSKGQTWTLPNGQSAEQIGSRRNDVVLAWAQDGSPPLDEAGLKSHWPQSETVEKIGDNLFLIRGVESPTPETASEPAAQLTAPESPSPPSPLPPRARGEDEEAEQALSAARQSGDKLRIVHARRGMDGGGGLQCAARNCPAAGL